MKSRCLGGRDRSEGRGRASERCKDNNSLGGGHDGDGAVSVSCFVSTLGGLGKTSKRLTHSSTCRPFQHRYLYAGVSDLTPHLSGMYRWGRMHWLIGGGSGGFDLRNESVVLFPRESLDSTCSNRSTNHIHTVLSTSSSYLNKSCYV